MVEVEEDNTCSGSGTECTHPILPGQTWRGNWYGPGDEDYFAFVAGAGTVVRATLERAETTLPAQHPDAPAPELLLAAPDGFGSAASEPLGLEDTGGSLEATLTHDGFHQLVARTRRARGITSSPSR